MPFSQPLEKSSVYVYTFVGSQTYKLLNLQFNSKYSPMHRKTNDSEACVPLLQQKDFTPLKSDTIWTLHFKITNIMTHAVEILRSVMTHAAEILRPQMSNAIA